MVSTKNVAGWLLMPALIITAALSGCAESEESEQTGYSNLPELEMELEVTVSESDDLMLSNIYVLTVDSDGDMIFSDFQQRAVYAVDADGEYIQRIGSRGSGPGEFEVPGMLTLDSDDNLHVFDVSRRTMSKFTKNENGWEFESSFVTDFQSTGWFSAFWPEEDEYKVVSSPPSMSEDRQMVVRTIDRDNQILQDSLYTFSAAESFMMMENGFPVMSLTIPEIHQQGRYIRGYDGTYFYGWTGDFTILKQDPDETELTPFIDLNLERRPLTSADGDTLISRYSGAFEGHSTARRDFRSELPDEMPLYNNMLADDSGRLWLRLISAPARSEGEEWIQFNSDGEPASRLNLPERERLSAVRHNRLYTVAYDENDVPGINVRIIEN